ncbi:MAG: hypothetical protein KAT34_10890 [Candidatus Aminicenantes bacterium]|nr:hypothetical protein [Candidatus Aminicenantes bacterium]
MKRIKKSPTNGTRSVLTAFAVFTVLIFSLQCTKQANKETKNIEQIYKKQ